MEKGYKALPATYVRRTLEKLRYRNTMLFFANYRRK